MLKTNRRKVLRSGAVLSAGIVSGAVSAPIETEAKYMERPTSKWEHEYTFGHTILFMEEYHRGTLEILGRLRGELEHIGELSSRAVHTIKNGGTVFYAANVGHLPGYAIKENVRGNPNIMKDKEGRYEGKSEDFDSLKKGDMIFTYACNRSIQKARDRGVYVVAVTANYINNEFRPEDFTNPNEDDLLLGDVSNEILHSHVPYYQGLVHVPEIPEITICPSTMTGEGTLFWMINAEIAQKLYEKQSGNVDKGAHYLRILTERVEQVKGHMDRIREVAVTMARRIRAGGTWFVRSIEHTGIETDLHWVECGPMIVNRGNWDAAKGENVMLICGISPAYPDEIRLALEKQIEGAFVIGVGPQSLDGEVPVGGRLIDVADAGFDNFSTESGGVVTIKKLEHTICPTGEIVDNIIQQMICAQWTDEMVRRGSIPYFFKGVCQVKGREFNDVMIPYADAQGF